MVIKVISERLAGGLISDSKAAYCDVRRDGLIGFTGNDTQTFLQNQLSCDVDSIAAGASTYGAYCTPKGRVLASFLLWRSEHGYFMQLPSLLRESIQKQLTKFILRSKVKAADASGDWAIIGIAGKDAALQVQRVIGPIPQNVHDVVHTPAATVIRLPGDRYEIVAAREKVPRILELLASGAERLDPEGWDLLDIRAGIPTILPSTQEQFVPQMLNLDLIGGVNFEKGCYPGQEIVARMHYRGTLKQRMYLANISGSDRPQPGEKLYSSAFGEQTCGTIVNAARLPEGGHDVLAVIQIASAEKGDVHWRSPDGPALNFQPLPYEVATDG